MQSVLLALVLVTSPEASPKQYTKPGDFVPLTSLPWKQPHATMEGVLKAIYLEPDINIRYPVLAEYLRTMPVERLGKAFDLCISDECAQTPNDLVGLFLRIWAERDPEKCWLRTQALFKVVGFEEGWLDYKCGSGDANDGDFLPMKVQDKNALQASPFWINSEALVTFPLGIEQSSLPDKRRTQMLRDFAARWFDSFGTWPDQEPSRERIGENNGYPAYQGDLPNAFALPIDKLSDYIAKSHPYDDMEAVEIARRRLMLDHPARILKIINKSEEDVWQISDTDRNAAAMHTRGPSIALLMEWTKIDPAGIIHWADNLDQEKVDLTIKARGYLMSRVDAVTRTRWLAQDRPNADGSMSAPLINEWAGWDPSAALDAAVATRSAEVILNTAYGAANTAGLGPFPNAPFNSRGYGFGILKGFDVSKLPPELQKSVGDEWEGVMESWGDVDVGEAARYGVNFLLRTNYLPRQRVLRVLGGEDRTFHDDGMMDRTFCAVRVWAAFKPDDFKRWIRTLSDADVRKALTWLLNHAWDLDTMNDAHESEMAA